MTKNETTNHFNEKITWLIFRIFYWRIRWKLSCSWKRGKKMFGIVRKCSPFIHIFSGFGFNAVSIIEMQKNKSFRFHRQIKSRKNLYFSSAEGFEIEIYFFVILNFLALSTIKQPSTWMRPRTLQQYYVFISLIKHLIIHTQFKKTWTKMYFLNYYIL